MPHDFPAHLYVLIVCAFYLRQISGQCCPAPFTLRATACICRQAFAAAWP
ncbi:hypothetical protein F652_1738 [Enterobacteriaceae bacterium bta3-1]|nr:hypothetical protein F652_1738 [Enterobacteriaceae bacterium bta3-1]